MSHSITTAEFIKFANQHPDIKVLGVIGNPISHSKSPLLHNSFYKKNAVSAEYFAIEVKNPDDLSFLLSETEKIGNCHGFNVTIPFKHDVFRFYPSEKYDSLQAVNTLYKQNGQWVSENTDWLGFIEPIQSMNIQSALILGWGGAASAVAFGLKNMNSAVKIEVFSRRESDITDSSLRFIKADYSVFPIKNRTYDLIVNTTPLGMSSVSENFTSLFLESLPKTKAAYDLIYNPPETVFLKHYQSNGTKTINGLSMFFEQASQANKFWFGINFPAVMKSDFFAEINA